MGDQIFETFFLTTAIEAESVIPDKGQLFKTELKPKQRIGFSTIIFNAEHITNLEITMDFNFLVSLIEVARNLPEEMVMDLRKNCTFVKNNIWIYEGEPLALNAKFRILDEGVVGSLGDLSQEELIKLCKERFDFDESLLH